MITVANSESEVKSLFRLRENTAYISALKDGVLRRSTISIGVKGAAS